jgi:GT2 family glycosyltransferase
VLSTQRAHDQKQKTTNGKLQTENYIRAVKLSVIIVNYNVKYFLEQALHSVRKAAKGMDVEVFVVDNNSVDGSCEMVKRTFPDVVLIENKDNPGFSKANNQAIRLSKGEYVLLLNPDTVVEEDCFEKVCAFMDKTPDAGALGVKMIDGKGRFLPESKRGLPTPEVAFYKMFGLSAIFPKSKRFGRYHLGFLDKKEIHKVDVLAGAFMLLRRKTLDEIGLLDEDYFMYGEDIDLSYRITKAGYFNYYFPDTTIIHYKGESTKKSSVNYVLVFYRAMIIFAQKHYSQKHAQVFSILINAAVYARACVALVFRLVSNIYLWMLDMLFFFLSVNSIAYAYAEYKFETTEAYSAAVVSLNSLIYALLWALGLFVAGGYQKRASISDVAKGIALGTLAITVFYAFAGESYRFSRAIIVLGTVAAGLCAYLLRLLVYTATHKRFSATLDSNIKTIIVGNKQEVARVQHLLIHSKAKSDYLGYVSVKEEQQHDEHYLGTEKQLSAIVELFKVEEIIFCSKDLSTQQIMQWMYTISKPDVHFKIVPEESVFIIGSNSKDEPGDFYTLEINLALNTPKQLRKKRVFDVVMAVLFIPLVPILLLAVKNKTDFILNIFKVLLGEKTWVGYTPVSNMEVLPKIKPSVLHTLGNAAQGSVNEIAIQKINFLYAKEYSIEKDLTIILKSLHLLGN